jgi:type VI secretion system protein ImpA
MPDSIELDFDALLAPIAGDNPAGDGVPFTDRAKLDEFRTEIDPAQWAEDDPMRPKESRPPDWRGIIRLTQKTLTDASKDLLIAARLTEALTRETGFAGLREGLRLMREMVEQCWDRLNPPIEDGDLEVRATPFYWLTDVDKGARFPHSLALVPLVWREEGGQRIHYGWSAWDGASKDQVSQEDRDKAIRETPLEECETTGKAIDESVEACDLLSASLAERMSSAAPDLGAIRHVLTGCQGLMHQILRDKRPLATAEADIPSELGGSGVESRGNGRMPATRAEAYRQLSQAAAVLREIEPHSPIPYLVQKAVELGGLPFPELMRALIRDANVLSELNRELGIKEEPPSQ